MNGPKKVLVDSEYGFITCDGKEHKAISYSWNGQVPPSVEIYKCTCLN